MAVSGNKNRTGSEFHEGYSPFSVLHRAEALLAKSADCFDMSNSGLFGDLHALVLVSTFPDLFSALSRLRRHFWETH